MNYFSLELIDGADMSLNFLSEPRFVTLIKSWQNAVCDHSKGKVGHALWKIFLVAHSPLIFVFKAINQQETKKHQLCTTIPHIVLAFTRNTFLHLERSVPLTDSLEQSVRTHIQ